MMRADDEALLSVLFRSATLRWTYAQIAVSDGLTRSAVAGMVSRLRDAHAQVVAARLPDHEILRVVDRVLSGASADSVAKDFARRRVSLSRLAVLYLVWWVMNDLHHAGPDLSTDAGNADLHAWPQWWRAAATTGVAA